MPRFDGGEPAASPLARGDDELDATIAGATFRRLIGGDRVGGGAAHGFDARRRDAERFEAFADGGCARARQALILFEITFGVGKAFDANGDARGGDQSACQRR